MPEQPKPFDTNGIGGTDRCMADFISRVDADQASRQELTLAMHRGRRYSTVQKMVADHPGEVSLEAKLQLQIFCVLADVLAEVRDVNARMDEMLNRD